MEPTTQFESDLLNVAYDFVTKQPLVNAQIIDCPGNHSFSKETIDMLVAQAKGCPRCTGKANFCRYSPNPDLQRIVDTLCHLQKAVRPAAPKETNVSVYPFPKNKFAISSIGGRTEGQGMARELWNWDFINENPEGTINYFYFRTHILDPYWNKELKPPEFTSHLRCHNILNAQALVTYLKNLGFEMQYPQPTEIYYYTPDIAVFKRFMGVIMNANDFSENDLAEIAKETKDMEEGYKWDAHELAAKRSNQASRRTSGI